MFNPVCSRRKDERCFFFNRSTTIIKIIRTFRMESILGSYFYFCFICLDTAGANHAQLPYLPLIGRFRV